jgi:UDP-N-acetyl-D-galactosamine dehydrogenase
MGEYITSRVIKLMLQRRLHVVDSRILVLGLAFKENCPDLRNTRVVDIIREFRSYSAEVTVHDPNVDPEEAMHEYDLALAEAGDLPEGRFDAVVLAVAHQQFRDMGVERVRRFLKPNGVLFDVKYLFDRDQVDGRL